MKNKKRLANKTQKEIATACEVSQQAVCLWMKRGIVPARRVMAVSALTGIPPCELNPEVFPPGR